MMAYDCSWSTPGCFSRLPEMSSLHDMECDRSYFDGCPLPTRYMPIALLALVSGVLFCSFFVASALRRNNGQGGGLGIASRVFAACGGGREQGSLIGYTLVSQQDDAVLVDQDEAEMW